MVLTILKWIGVAMILSLIALWLWQGGYWRIAEYAQIIPSAVSSTSETRFVLPGQPEFWQVPDTTYMGDVVDYGAADYENPTDRLYEGEASYQTIPQPQTDRSVYNGYVRLQAGMTQTTNPHEEYVILSVSGNPSPIDLSGWSLRSALTGERAVIPLAAWPFVQGVVNSVGSIRAYSGDVIIVSTGASPVGVSFRETTCTGYLAQTQKFYPSLSNACPRPSDLLPHTAQNESQYGSSCLEYVDRLPQCSYPVLLPSSLSNACRTYLTNTFTYAGCMHAYGSGNALNTWRAYLASGRELWRDSHDVIQLLDSEGQIVDTLSF